MEFTRIFVICTLLTSVMSLFEGYPKNHIPKAEFSLFDDEEDGENEYYNKDDSESDEKFLLDLIEPPINLQRSSWNKMWDADLRDETLDSEDDSNLIKLLREGYRFSLKLSDRMKTLDKVSSEFDTFVLDGYTISNHWFQLILKLDNEVGVNYEFRETILNMMAQAERNIESIHKVTAMYKDGIIDKSGLGKLETIITQYNKIASLYDDTMDDMMTTHSISTVIQSLKADTAETVKKEKSILRLFRIFMEEQRNLITLGKKLWVYSQEDYERRYDDAEEEFEDDGGIKRNPTQADVLKQILEVKRRRAAISAYSQFLKKHDSQNKTSTATNKDEL